MGNFYLKKITTVNILLVINIAFSYKNSVNCTENFKKLVDKGVFVDKSHFIKEFLECESKVMLITRPTGFGKSINLDMLKTFLEIEVDEYGNSVRKKKNKKYFKNLKIAKDKRIFNDYFGKYPVIYVSFKNVGRHSKYDFNEQKMEAAVRIAFLQHRYLLQVKSLNEFEKNMLSKYFNSSKLSLCDIEHGLDLLKELLFKHFQKRPFIFVDDYDRPFYIQFVRTVEDYIKKEINLITNILNIIYNVKNEYVERGLICGVTQLPESDLHYFYIKFANYELNTVLGNKFSSSFGFTDKEVTDLLKKLNKSNLQNTMKQWYGGYHFYDNKLELYNSWSVMKCLENVNNKFDNYLMYADDMIILQHFIHQYQMRSYKLDKLFTIIQNISYTAYYKAITLCKKPNYKSTRSISTMGVHFGYLTVTNIIDEVKITVSIPNIEVLNIFSILMVKEMFSIKDNEIEKIGHLIRETVRRKNFIDLNGKINSSEYWKRFIRYNADINSIHGPIVDIRRVRHIYFYDYIYLFLIICKYNYDFEIFTYGDCLKNETKLDISVAVDVNECVLIPHNGKGSEAYIVNIEDFWSQEDACNSSRKNEINNRKIKKKYKILSKKYPYIKTICIINVRFDTVTVEILHEMINL